MVVLRVELLAAIVIVVALLAGSADAANYYVSTTGSNSNSGTSLASPFLTIQQAANVAQPGDNVYVRGGTYRETVTMARSGTASAPITFQPYQNEQVTITGLDMLSGGWSTYSGSTYQNTVAGGASQLFVNGQMMTEARSANSGYNNPLATSLQHGRFGIDPSPPTISTITSCQPRHAQQRHVDRRQNGDLSVASGWVHVEQSITSQTGNTLNFQWPYATPTTLPTAPRPATVSTFTAASPRSIRPRSIITTPRPRSSTSTPP